MKVSTSDKRTIDYEPGNDCPSCSQKMWDNRTNKRNPKGPDFKCDNKGECGLAMWIFKPKANVSSQGADKLDKMIAVLQKIEENTRKEEKDWGETDGTE